MKENLIKIGKFIIIFGITYGLGIILVALPDSTPPDARLVFYVFGWMSGVTFMSLIKEWNKS